MSKTNRFTIRYDNDEVAVIKSKMQNLGITNHSRYIRFMSLNGFVIKTDAQSFNELTKAFKNVEYELNAIGNNVNQIAMKLNSDEEVLIDEFLEIKRTLKKIQNENIKNFNIAFNENAKQKTIEKGVVNGLH